MLSQSRSILSSTVSSQPSAVSDLPSIVHRQSSHHNPLSLPALSVLPALCRTCTCGTGAGRHTWLFLSGLSMQGSSFVHQERVLNLPISNHQSKIKNQKSSTLFDFGKRIPSFPPTCIQYSGSGSKTTRYGGGKYSNFFRYEERITPSAFSSFLSSHRFYRLGQGIV